MPENFNTNNIIHLDAQGIKKNIKLYFLKLLFEKTFLGIAAIIFAAYFPAIVFYVLTVLFRVLSGVLFVLAGVSLIKMFKFLFIVMYCSNSVVAIYRLFRLYPIDLFYIEGVSKKESMTLDRNISSIRTFIYNSFVFILSFAGKMASNGIYMILQGWMLFFKQAKYWNILVILTQSESSIPLDIIHAYTNIDKVKLRKRLESLIDGLWVLETTSGFVLTSEFREKFDPTTKNTVFIKKKKPVEHGVSTLTTANEINHLYKSEALNSTAGLQQNDENNSEQENAQ
ncbi:hypothetical protein AAEX28_12060 [Lentisphaerota bacterium WC36G]|nr:hypothetical protein LJT99_14895 [Lentisphaerae bacterium WC36]